MKELVEIQAPYLSFPLRVNQELNIIVAVKGSHNCTRFFNGKPELHSGPLTSINDKESFEVAKHHCSREDFFFFRNKTKGNFQGSPRVPEEEDEKNKEKGREKMEKNEQG